MAMALPTQPLPRRGQSGSLGQRWEGDCLLSGLCPAPIALHVGALLRALACRLPWNIFLASDAGQTQRAGYKPSQLRFPGPQPTGQEPGGDQSDRQGRGYFLEPHGHDPVLRPQSAPSPLRLAPRLPGEWAGHT